MFILLRNSTDPTYKEWKRVFVWVDILRREKHGSYLQGMETLDLVSGAFHRSEHGSYLQGMETSSSGVEQRKGQARTDPTYKEWKPVFCLYPVSH